MHKEFQVNPQNPNLNGLIFYILYTQEHVIERVSNRASLIKAQMLLIGLSRNVCYFIDKRGCF